MIVDEPINSMVGQSRLSISDATGCWYSQE